MLVSRTTAATSAKRCERVETRWSGAAGRSVQAMTRPVGSWGRERPGERAPSAQAAQRSERPAPRHRRSRVEGREGGREGGGLKGNTSVEYNLKVSDPL